MIQIGTIIQFSCYLELNKNVSFVLYQIYLLIYKINASIYRKRQSKINMIPKYISENYLLFKKIILMSNGTNKNQYQCTNISSQLISNDSFQFKSYYLQFVSSNNFSAHFLRRCRYKYLEQYMSHDLLKNNELKAFQSSLKC